MRNIGIVAQLHLGIATMSAQCNTKLTKFSIKCHPVHPGIHKDPFIRAQTWVAYDILMGARVVHSWNSKLAILE